MENSTYRPQPVSFVRRGSRLQGRREKAWEENREQFLIDVPRALADTSVDPEYRFDAAAAFGRDASRAAAAIAAGLDGVDRFGRIDTLRCQRRCEIDPGAQDVGIARRVLAADRLAAVETLVIAGPEH